MNPSDVQVLFTHLQTSIVADSRTVAPKALGRAAGALARGGTILGLPMTFAVVPGKGDLLPELGAFATEADTFPRHAASPFLDPATVEALAYTGRRTLVIAGFASEVASLHAALDGIAAGYAVQVPVDANGGMSERTEAAALRRIEAAGGMTTSVFSLSSMLTPDFAPPTGARVLAALDPLRPGHP